MRLLRTLRESGLWFPLLASAAALGVALVGQYAFGLHPCHLCIFQRWPYGIAVAGALLAAALLRTPAGWRRALWALAAAVSVSGGIGMYHVGVEQHWIAGPTGCSGGATAGLSIEELRAQIMNAELVRCDTPELLVLGLSMAAWNVLYAFAVAAFTLFLARRLP